MTKKELTFKFFKENPQVLNETYETENYKLLGIKWSTYNRHLLEYKSINEANKCVEETETKNYMYFEIRVREKFIFDDSKLFG